MGVPLDPGTDLAMILSALNRMDSDIPEVQGFIEMVLYSDGSGYLADSLTAERFYEFDSLEHAIEFCRAGQFERSQLARESAL